MSETTDREKGYIEGSRWAFVRILNACAHELGHGDPLAEAAARLSEREQAVSALRQICEQHGDNEWPNELHLADVVSKHLEGHLDEAAERFDHLRELAATLVGITALSVAQPTSEHLARLRGLVEEAGLEDLVELVTKEGDVEVHTEVPAWRGRFEEHVAALRDDPTTGTYVDRFLEPAMRLGIDTEHQARLVLTAVGYRPDQVAAVFAGT